MTKSPTLTQIMEVSGSSTRSMSIFGIKFDFCQEIPAIFLSPRDPNQPGKFSMRFKTNELGLGFEMDISAVMHGLFGKNFFEFVVLRSLVTHLCNCSTICMTGGLSGFVFVGKDSPTSVKSVGMFRL